MLNPHNISQIRIYGNHSQWARVTCPPPRITLIYVEAREGAPTGKVTVAEPGRPERVEWWDPATLRAGVDES